jgi:hypothetical protein
MRVPAPQQPRRESTRWEVVRDALGSNAKTARLCLIWLVMTGAPVTALAELVRHVRLQRPRISQHGGNTPSALSAGLSPSDPRTSVFRCQRFMQTSPNGKSASTSQVSPVFQEDL